MQNGSGGERGRCQAEELMRVGRGRKIEKEYVAVKASLSLRYREPISRLSDFSLVFIVPLLSTRVIKEETINLSHN